MTFSGGKKMPLKAEAPAAKGHFFFLFFFLFYVLLASCIDNGSNMVLIGVKLTLNRIIGSSHQ